MHPQLKENGYRVMEGLIAPELARVIYKTLLLQHWRGESFRDNHMPTSSAVTNIALTDAMLLDLLPTIEAAAGCALLPTYSYARVYFHGDTMVRHVDRPSCEVSVSVNLGSDGGNGSLWFQPDNEVALQPGDGAVYLGCDTGHWRERYTGNALGQIFLHYVRKDGPFASNAFDGQPDRFPPSVSQGLLAQP